MTDTATTDQEGALGHLRDAESRLSYLLPALVLDDPDAGREVANALESARAAISDLGVRPMPPRWPDAPEPAGAPGGPGAASCPTHGDHDHGEHERTGGDEHLVRQAAELVAGSGLGSTRILERKLSVGPDRAGWLMDELEALGVVGPAKGSETREVYMNLEGLEDVLPEG